PTHFAFHNCLATKRLKINWKDAQQLSLQAASLAPSDDRELAIVSVLASAAYTVVLRGRDATTGIGPVEVFEVP
ncbi:MAG: hypothetical protein ABI871_04875, partial [Chthoniobacterales bacterium]